MSIRESFGWHRRVAPPILPNRILYFYFPFLHRTDVNIGIYGRVSLLQHWSRDIFDWGFTLFIGREPEGESAAFLQLAAHGHLTVMDQGKPLDDAEAKTTAPHFAAACFVGAIETVK